MKTHFLILLLFQCSFFHTYSQPLDISSKVSMENAIITSTPIDIGSVEQVFDGDTTTLARSNENPAWIQVEFPESKTINSIRVLLGEPGFAFDVNDWWVEGADVASDLENQSGTYELIVDTRSGVTGDWDFYLFPAPVSKKICRVWVRRTVGDNFVHIPEITFYEDAEEINLLPETLQQYEGWIWRNLPDIFLLDNNVPVGENEFIWTSLDSSVAYIDTSGNVISVSAGTTSIIVSYKDEVSDTMEVTVKGALRPIRHITQDPFINVPAENAVHEVPVLIISFIPTDDNMYVDRSYSPNLQGSLETVKEFDSLVTTYIKRIKFAKEQGTRFRNFKNPSSRPSIGYKVLDYITIYEPLPPSVPLLGYNDGALHYGPDYEQIFERLNVKDYVENQGVKEIWIWATGVHETYPGYIAEITPPENFRASVESNMSSPLTGDISNSTRVPNDLPVYCNSYVVIHGTHHRDQTINMEPHTHQIESMITYINERQDGNSDLFWKKFVGEIGRAGWTHMPPNTTINYGYFSYIQHDTSLVKPVLSDNEDWTPDNIGEKKLVSYHNWEDLVFDWPDGISEFELRRELQWFIYWMQTIPGYNNYIPYGTDKTITNWWDIIARWDSVITNNLGLYQMNMVTAIDNQFQFTNSGINNFGYPLVAYPNPSQGNLTIELGQEYHDVKVSIINPYGQVISKGSYPVSERLTIRLTGNEGLYQLEIDTREGKKAVLKIVKE